MFSGRASLQYGFAILAVAAALALRWALKPVLEDRLPYLLSFLAALLLSLYVGVWPSLLALGLGLLGGTFFFVGWNGFLQAENLARVGLYLLVGVWAATVGNVFRRSRKRAEDLAN